MRERPRRTDFGRRLPNGGNPEVTMEAILTAVFARGPSTEMMEAMSNVLKDPEHPTHG